MERISMRGFQIRLITLIIILLFFVVIIFGIQQRLPAEKTNVDIYKVPLNIGEWQGEEIIVDKKTRDILETESVLIRRYTKENNSVWLAIIYYKDSKVALHLPESCYVGQGSYIVKRDIEEISIPGLKNFNVNELVLKGNKGNQLILYYFETGDIRTSSYQTMRWQMMLNKLRAKSNSCALIRFSSLIEKNPEEILAILKQFINEAAPLLSNYL